MAAVAYKTRLPEPAMRLLGDLLEAGGVGRVEWTTQTARAHESLARARCVRYHALGGTSYVYEVRAIARAAWVWGAARVLCGGGGAA